MTKALSLCACIALTALTALMASGVRADVYLHNFRGSNNRLNEANAERNQGNRLFDSQNNNRGGYNVGDKYNQAFQNTPAADGLGTGSGTPLYGHDPSWASAQYSMVYLEGSEIDIEWTAQHGCATGEGQGVNNCNYVLQYTCDTDPALVTDRGLQVQLRDGSATTQSTAPQAPQANTRSLSAIQAVVNQNNGFGDQTVKGRHENEFSYWECLTRARNTWLYLADNKPNGASARFTRQNPNGNRNGLECPEERDYYPYWGPTIWRDIAYLTDNTTLCDNIVLPNTQNTHMKYKCVDPNDNYAQALYAPILPDLCSAATDTGGTPVTAGVWRGFTHNLPPPDCRSPPWSRANHLGNADRGLEPARYTWKLPTVDQLKGSGALTYHGDMFARCVFRLRYNISTTDFNPWTTSSRSNTNAGSNANNNDEKPETAADMTSPVTQNPIVDVGLPTFHDYDNDGTTFDDAGLRLAVDTDQFGRTFQDRSHVFYIHRRSAGLQNGTGIDANTRVHNLNVRGKRGNIVQTYPAVEYDFMPNKLTVAVGDLIHVQWTGSNTHNNNGGGDGQGGDAGQGTGGTDRNNFVQMANVEDNFPMPQDKMAQYSLFAQSECFDPISGAPIAPLDCTVRLATGGHFQSTAHALATYGSRPFQVQQNTSPASFVNGVLMRFKPVASGKQFPFMCTRNNSFSNRSQKGIITVA